MEARLLRVCKQEEKGRTERRAGGERNSTRTAITIFRAWTLDLSCLDLERSFHPLRCVLFDRCKPLPGGVNTVFKTDKQQGATVQQWKPAQCHVAAWAGGVFRGDWVRVYVWLSPFAVH